MLIAHLKEEIDAMSTSTTLPEHTKVSRPSSQFLQPFHRLREEVDRMFDDFPAHLPHFRLPPFVTSAPLPAIEITEKPKSYRITVELPGVDPDDIRLDLDGDVLILRGEKRSDREEKDEDYTLTERNYGAFERRVTLPADARSDDVEAKMKSGVLKISVPRDREGSLDRRRIEIGSAD
jgi:HSP20 family protein